jgi:TIR domain
LSHSHEDAEWVEALARRLEDEQGFQVWLDRWKLVPGQSWQHAMAMSLTSAKSCAICVGGTTPSGWFKEELEAALNLQASRPSFRIIPVILPDGSDELMPLFLKLRTWADFRPGKDHDYAFHVIVQGIRASR